MGDSSKKIVPRMKDYEDDGPWMWVAFAPGCRLIISFVIGPRKQYIANELVQLTAECLSDSMPLFVSDGLEFYAKAILKEFGKIEEFPRTGKRGRPKKPKLVPPDDLRVFLIFSGFSSISKIIIKFHPNLSKPIYTSWKS